MRKSINIRHHDKYLDNFTPHVKDVNANRAKYYRDGKSIHKMDSQIIQTKDLAECYDEAHDLTLELSYTEFLRDMKANETIRPSEGSNE
jgi:hypothetical protein